MKWGAKYTIILSHVIGKNMTDKFSNLLIIKNKTKKCGAKIFKIKYKIKKTI